MANGRYNSTSGYSNTTMSNNRQTRMQTRSTSMTPQRTPQRTPVRASTTPRVMMNQQQRNNISTRRMGTSLSVNTGRMVQPRMGARYQRSTPIAQRNNLNPTYARRLQSAGSPIASARLQSRNTGMSNRVTSGNANRGSNHLQRRVELLNKSYGTVKAPGTRLKK